MAGKITGPMEYRIVPRMSLGGYSLPGFEPARKLSQTGLLNYVLEHPNDRFMREHLSNLDPENCRTLLGQARQRFETDPSPISLDILMSMNRAATPKTAAALKDALRKNPFSMRQLLLSHPDPSFRAMADTGNVRILRLLNQVYELNRDHVIDLADLIPPEVRAAFQNIAEDYGERVFASGEEKRKVYPSEDLDRSATLYHLGTGYRSMTPMETYDRLTESGAISVVSNKNGGNLNMIEGSYTAVVNVSWPFKAAYESGRNNYSVSGDFATMASGLTVSAVSISMVMKMLEAQSLIAGISPNWPGDYAVDPGFIQKGSQDLYITGKNPLDLARFSLKAPYRGESITWVRGEEQTLSGAREVYVPAQMVYRMLNLDEPEITRNTQFGVGAGNNMEEAKIHALSEIFNADGRYTSIYSRGREFRLEIGNEKIRKIMECFEGIDVRFVDLTQGTNIPVYEAFITDGVQIMRSSWSDLDGGAAAVKAMQTLFHKYAMSGTKDEVLWQKQGDAADDIAVRQYEELPSYRTGSLTGDLFILEQCLIYSGYPPIYVDLTRKDIGVPVVRAIVPGLGMPEGVSARRIGNILNQAEQ